MKTRRGPLETLLIGCALIASACSQVRVEPGDSRTPPDVEPKPETEPESVPPGPFVAVAVAVDRSCALDDEGSVFCWGLDLLSPIWGDVALAPRRVEGVESASQVALTDSYACALIDGQGIQCWGVTPFTGEQDVDAEPSLPFFLTDSSSAVDFALSSGRTCAVLASGGVRCWGTMQDPGGCFNDGSPAANPFDLPGVKDATTITVSGSSTCFTRRAGLAACYVDGPDPQIFELDFEQPEHLVVSQSDGCFSAHASYCAVLAQGQIDCYDGVLPTDLGSVVNAHDGSPPAVSVVWMGFPDDYCIQTQAGALWCSAAEGGTVLQPSEASEVAMTSTHACAVSDGEVHCWGSNEWGALGVGVPARRADAKPVAGLLDAVALGVGEDHSCAARSNGDVVCWGSNQAAQRGWEASPVAATYLPRWAWYPDERSELPKPVPSIPAASHVFADNYRTCATQTDGAVLCWGQDLTARMALASPTEIPDVTAATSVATGDDSESCAVVAGGAVECWGRGWYGSRVGVETLSLPAPALQVDGDTYQACALLETGDVYCWGGYVEGSIGADGDPLMPQKLAGVDDAIDLSGTCVVNSAHELVCWAFSWQPSWVANGMPTVIANAVRDVDGPCVVRDDGGVECAVDYGELDSAGSSGFEQVNGVAGATRVASGAQHACALIEGGQVACWGWAAAGRLGDGSRTVFTEPQTVAVP
jgi:Regulator of chromosome condensation (RCC1) repeat